MPPAQNAKAAVPVPRNESGLPEGDSIPPATETRPTVIATRLDQTPRRSAAASGVHRSSERTCTALATHAPNDALTPASQRKTCSTSKAVILGPVKSTADAAMGPAS